MRDEQKLKVFKCRPIYYDEVSKIFRINKESPSWLTYLLNNKDSGYLNNGGYFKVGMKGKQFLAHRIVYSIHNKIDLGDIVVDHIDRNTENNNPANLRLADIKLNNMNCSLRKDNESGIKGVRLINYNGYFYWCARWKENGKLKEKTFSAAKLGSDIAKKCAIDLREKKVKENFDNYSLSMVNDPL